MIRAAAFAVAGLTTVLAIAQEHNPAPWAYPVLDPTVQPPADDGIRRTLVGSTASFTLAQMFDPFNVYDWFPESHPTMPEVVAHGRKPDVEACGTCHLPNGQGQPANAGIGGLSAKYIVRQMADFKSGARRSSVPSFAPQQRMIAAASHATDDDIELAAAYFAEAGYRPWIRVVETDEVPKVELLAGSMWALIPASDTEPIGRRIVEVPQNLGLAQLRDPRSGFVAYVPIGSLQRGETIVESGYDEATRCSSCHGDGLHGGVLAPPIAGRSAVYLVRQLHDFQSGARAGVNAELMKPAVRKLTLDDMIAVAAYVASLLP